MALRATLLFLLERDGARAVRARAGVASPLPVLAGARAAWLWAQAAPPHALRAEAGHRRPSDVLVSGVGFPHLRRCRRRERGVAES